MARKKTTSLVEEFTPSIYQKRIFDYIQHGQGNILIEASAGSGKTTTILKALDLIPQDKRVLFAAFNKDIVNVLSKKTKQYPNVETTTLHALGYSIIRANFKGLDISLDLYKYETEISINLEAYSKMNLQSMKWKKKLQYIANIKKFLELGRMYLCETPKELSLIEDRYGIEVIGDEKEVAVGLMRWGKNNIETVDFADMVWLPNVLYLKPYGHQYDFIMVDEVQDLDKSKRELLLKCVKLGTRICAVGDSSQCIYSFSGSDPESFEEFKKIPNTECFPLSISYRCADKIVENAQKIVSTIEKNNDGREGEVIYDVPIEEVRDGDMIICRTNAPLVQIYCMFLKLGKPCYILGKEIGKNLKQAISAYNVEELSQSCSRDGLFPRLYRDLFTSRDNLMANNAIDEETALSSSIIQAKLDTILALETLSDGISTTKELMDKIDTIFPKKSKKNGIVLSTIHKAKGLEADRVYIACASLMPSKSAKKPWEIEQEKNLMYVAYTRAKNVLGFLDEREFERFNTYSQNNNKRLKSIEDRVNVIFGTIPRKIANKDIAKAIIERSKPIVLQSQPKNNVTISKDKPYNTPNTMLGVIKKPKLKRIKI